MARIKPHIHEYPSPSAESCSAKLGARGAAVRVCVRAQLLCERLRLSCGRLRHARLWCTHPHKPIVHTYAQGRGESAHKGGRKSRSRKRHKAPLPHAFAKSESPANLPNRHYQLAYCKFYASAAQSPNFFLRNA